MPHDPSRYPAWAKGNRSAREPLLEGTGSVAMPEDVMRRLVVGVLIAKGMPEFAARVVESPDFDFTTASTEVKRTFREVGSVLLTLDAHGMLK